MSVPISIIVAMTKQGVIGNDNALPWHLPADLKRFKTITMGHPIIMGRKTFESIGRVLPGRKNIVVSRNALLSLPPEVTLCSSLEEAISVAAKNTSPELPKEIFIIGGAQIFKEGLALATKLYVTWINKDFVGNIYFPDFQISNYTNLKEESFEEPFPHTFSTYERHKTSPQI